jgi:hypothetical protein
MLCMAQREERKASSFLFGLLLFVRCCAGRVASGAAGRASAVSLVIVGLWLLACAASAVQGLPVTWSRSRLRAALVVIALAVFLLVSPWNGPLRPGQEVAIILGVTLGRPTALIVMAIAAEYWARRLSMGKKR